MPYYKDLREYIMALEDNSKLVRIIRQINKDTELMPLVRCQFRGLDQKDRKAFLFENVTDVKGKKYDTRVLVASHAASREVYALAMMCKPEEIMKKWEQAQLNPIRPKIVKSGPAQEEIHIGDSLLEHGGLGEFAVPISTPGFDNAPYFTAGNSVTKDPDTGIRNIGTYRSMIKSPTRIGVSASGPKHMRQHCDKYRRQGIHQMQAAVAIGTTPNIGLVSVTGIPYGVDEYDVAGAIAGEPVELVTCKTVDLEVPATAEIVIEGFISTDSLERDGPFGEDTGYMGMGRPSLFLDVTCITHRKRPIWNAYISQFPPSESSLIEGMGMEASYYNLLKHGLGIAPLVDTAFHENAGVRQFGVFVMKNAARTQVWQTLYGAAAKDPSYCKVLIAVDDDIDPRDLDSIAWAICYRMQPHRDIRIYQDKVAGLDPSAVAPEEFMKMALGPPTSAILIDATRKWNYPPTSLPKKEFMEKAMKIWEEEGLPTLKLKAPWYGQSLGYWPEEVEEEAELALNGEHYKTGEKLAQKRTNAE